MLNLPALTMRRAISKEEINQLPVLSFQEEIVFCEREKEMIAALEELNEYPVVGFDTESKPTFKKGQFHHVALVQLAMDRKVFLFRVFETGIPQELADFFSNEDIVKVGIALDDDIKSLQKRKKFIPRSFVDLNQVATNLLIENIGVRNLSAIFLNGRVTKGQQTSNWENRNLTIAQKRYAATDAWVCLKIYEELAKDDLLDRYNYD